MKYSLILRGNWSLESSILVIYFVTIVDIIAHCYADHPKKLCYNSKKVSRLLLTIFYL